MWKKKKNNKKIIIYILVIIIFLYYFYIAIGNNYNFMWGIPKDFVSSIESIFVIDKKEIINKIDIDLNDSVKKENSELKELLKLNNDNNNFEFINASVISRNKSYWFNNLMIDKGKKDGIDLDMVVINNNGLIGIVSKVTNSNSEVRLITSNEIDFRVGVCIESNKDIYNGILSGYDIENDLLNVISIRSTSNIKVGDKVKTNGLGNIFPSGINIGEVKDISFDELGVSKILKVKTTSTLENIKYVSVIRSKKLD